MLCVVRAWILLSTLLVSAGWVLSLCHQLNPVGYAVYFALATIAWRSRPKRQPGDWRGQLARTVRQFLRPGRRPIVWLYYVLALMSMLGGLLYVSTDGDGLAYRIPRVMHWLWQAQWCWIRTQDLRMNIAGNGFEWLCAPIILFTHTDRWVFLINAFSYLLLPGLIFSVFVRLGVRPRVAWWWMWLLPSGWCYVMQAGSCHNDSYAVIYALASVDLALRARERQNPTDWWLALLAAALATSVKQTDIPLVLLWLVAAWPGRRLCFMPPLGGSVAIALGLLVSGLPMILLNLHYAGSWTGIPPQFHAELNSPFWGVLGNAFCLSVQNLAPPFIPGADGWNRAMHHFIQTPFGAHFSAFEDFGHLKHSISDETAGIGLGICSLLLISLVAAAWAGRSARPAQPPRTGLASHHLWLLRLTPWLLLLLYAAKVGTNQNARQLGPYYVFLFPLLLWPEVQAELLRRTWWRRLGLLVMALTALLLVTSRQRPLFPFQTLIATLQVKHPHSQFLEKTWNSFDFRSSFEKSRNLFQKDFPPDVTLVGYATTGGNVEPGLALPLGRLRIERLLPDDSPDQVRQAGIRYVVLDDFALRLHDESIAQWTNRFTGRLVDQMTFYLDPYEPPSHVYLVQLEP